MWKVMGRCHIPEGAISHCYICASLFLIFLFVSLLSFPVSFLEKKNVSEAASASSFNQGNLSQYM